MAWFKAIMFKENNNFFCSITDSDPSRYKLPLLSEQSTLWGCPDTTGGFAWNGKGKLSNWPGWSSLESTVHCGSATPDPVKWKSKLLMRSLRNFWIFKLSFLKTGHFLSLKIKSDNLLKLERLCQDIWVCPRSGSISTEIYFVLLLFNLVFWRRTWAGKLTLKHSYKPPRILQEMSSPVVQLLKSEHGSHYQSLKHTSYQS